MLRFLADVAIRGRAIRPSLLLLPFVQVGKVDDARIFAGRFAVAVLYPQSRSFHPASHQRVAHRFGPLLRDRLRLCLLAMAKHIQVELRAVSEQKTTEEDQCALLGKIAKFALKKHPTESNR